MLPVGRSIVTEIVCPNCAAGVTPLEVLAHSDVSWPELNWVWFHCPRCSKPCHIEVLDHQMATIRYLGAPGPDWERNRSWPVADLIIRADPGFFHCWLDSKHYEFPAKS